MQKGVPYKPSYVPGADDPGYLEALLEWPPGTVVTGAFVGPNGRAKVYSIGPLMGTGPGTRRVWCLHASGNITPQVLWQLTKVVD